MNSIRLINTQQVLFPNQRNDEKIFVVTRQHYIHFIQNFALIFFMILLPFILMAMLFRSSQIGNTLNSLYLKDFLYLAGCLYFLTALNFFMSNWITYYYNILIVTDERLVEIRQDGLFNRNINELSFERVQDVSCHTKGFWSTLFNAGNIEIQTSGAQANFRIVNVPLSSDVIGIISELSIQAKEGVSHRKRMPNLPVIGIIGTYYVRKNGYIPAIMNLNMDLECSENQLKERFENPKGLRDKIDRWWWLHRQQSALSIKRPAQKVDKNKIDLKGF